MSNEMTRTAPERIYLQVADGGEDDAPFPASHDDVTWCDVTCVENEVAYIRADLAAEREKESGSFNSIADAAPGDDMSNEVTAYKIYSAGVILRGVRCLEGTNKDSLVQLLFDISTQVAEREKESHGAVTGEDDKVASEPVKVDNNEPNLPEGYEICHVDDEYWPIYDRAYITDNPTTKRIAIAQALDHYDVRMRRKSKEVDIEAVREVIYELTRKEVLHAPYVMRCADKLSAAIGEG